MTPPLTQKTSHKGDWECSVCCDEYTSTSPNPWQDENILDDDGNKQLVCHKCIRHEFERGVENDHNWPPKWANRVLDAREFDALFDPTSLEDVQFLLKYWKMYLRITQQKFIRAIHDRTGALAGEVPEGWVRGKEYQRCPRCADGAELKEACNHMVCSCTCNYCYICGKEVLEEEKNTHWQAGGCPRYNHPDDENASYDAAADNEDEDSEGSEDFDDDDRFSDTSELEFDLPTFLSYAWNRAMQTADHPTRRLMRALLLRGQGFELNDESREQSNRVHAVMDTYRPSHGIDAEEWRAITTRYAFGTRIFLERPGVRYMPGNFPRDFFGFPNRGGLLTRKCGGIFEIVTRDGRQQAYYWIRDMSIAWRLGRMTTRQSALKNFAVFHLGPAGTADARRDAMYLLDQLVDDGARTTGGRVEFTQWSMNGQAILVEITALSAQPWGTPGVAGTVQGPFNPYSELGDWMLLSAAPENAE